MAPIPSGTVRKDLMVKPAVLVEASPVPFFGFALWQLEACALLVAATGDFHIGMKGRFREVFTFENVEWCVRKLDYFPVDVFLFCGDLSMSKRYDDNVKRAVNILYSANAKYRFMVVGNHDRWYDPSLRRVLSAPNYLKLLDGEGCYLDDLDLGVAGTMGWYDYSFSPKADVDCERRERAVKATSIELKKLEAGLRDIEGAGVKVVVMHFSPTPETVRGDPFIGTCGSSAFMELLEAYGVDYVFHGHSHKCRDDCLEDVVRGVKVFNVSCDKRGFTPLIVEMSQFPI
ncbi:MAG: metallophosphoesterase [Candidatus Freyarchaeota archaeon]|nr:metallophosphoesterase [Candidatus Jordarchaeia archaeon]